MSSSTDKPLVYLLLGAVGSGRREVVADLIEGGLAETDRAAVLLSSTEPASEADSRLGTVTRWTWANKQIAAELPAGATHVFFLTDGRANPVDQVEALKPWLEAAGAELARVICVANCRLAEQHPEMVAWYDACVHFSDIVLLNHRDGVANKWLSEFRRRYEDLFMPCLFEFVKAGRVKNPPLLIEPQARRMSLYFDEGGSLAVLPDEIEYEITDEDGNPVEADEKENDEDEDTGPEVDPYFALDAAGRRAKRIPDVAKFVS
jgi:hypothetical protein